MAKIISFALFEFFVLFDGYACKFADTKSLEKANL